ncbi:MAG TPA: hypothetical protein VIP11_07585 [Gemmatimonadaceae bacterium]
MRLSAVVRAIPFLLLAAACAKNDARVSVRYHEVTSLPLDLLTVTVDDGRAVRTLRGVEVRDGREVDTRNSGTLLVRFRFASGDPAASEGTIELPLRSDWAYGVQIFVDSLDPRIGCFGCQGSRGFPLAASHRRTAKDSVWVIWGGNSISNPVVY